MDLKYVKDLCRKNLSSDVMSRVEASLQRYLEESGEENIANVIGSVYQKVKKEFRYKNFTADNENDFWSELTRFWHLTEMSYFGINGKMDFDFDASKRGVYPYITALGGVEEVSRVAQFESLGGLPAIFDAIHRMMEKETTQEFITHLISKNFREYRKDFYAVQYIAVKYMESYRSDLHESRYKSFRFCVYDNRESPHNQMNVPGLNTILTLHLKERQL